MLKKIACLSILLTVIGIPSFAQKITATIRGTVTDSTGAVVPGANVTVRGEDTGATRSTVFAWASVTGSVRSAMAAPAGPVVS